LVWTHPDGKKLVSFTQVQAECPGLDPEAIHTADIVRRISVRVYPNETEKWVFQTGAAVRSSPVIIYVMVYIGSADGTLYALGEQEATLTATLTTSETDTATSAVTSATASTGGGPDS
jgi:outer membrane protein assembly factor BamB